MNNWTKKGSLQKSLTEYNLHKIIKSESATEDEKKEAQHELKFRHDESQLIWNQKNMREGYGSIK